MAEALGSNADLTTAYTKWLASKGVKVGTALADTNTVQRVALKAAGAYNTTNQDFTTLLRRFLNSRTAP